MRDRSVGRLLCLVVILAAGLAGCQTADTEPGSAAAALGARLAAGPGASVHPDAYQPRPVPSAVTTVAPAPQVVLASQTANEPTAPLPPTSLASLATPETATAAPASSASTNQAASPANQAAIRPSSSPRRLVADFAVATTVPAVPPATGAAPAGSLSAPAPPVLAPTAPAPTGPDASVPPAAPPVVASAPADPGGLGATTEPAGMPLTLDSAIATSLDRNETIVTLRAGEPVAQAMLEVAKRYPFNPLAKFEVLPYARDPYGNLLAVRNSVYIMQTLELAHQQRYREASAAAALNQVRWNVVAGELTNVATTEKLFFTALYQRDLRDLARQAAALNAQLAADVERRFQAGLSKPGEEITARVSRRQTQKQLALAEANARVALLTLTRQLNMPTDRPYELVGRLEDLQWARIDGLAGPEGSPPSAQATIQVAETLADERPDVRAAQAAANVAQANAELAQANTVQNLQFGPYYERDEFETLFFGVVGQMNIPIWNSGRPLARQREAECMQRVVTLSALRTRARVEVQTAIERYERARLLAEKERPNLSKSLSEDLARVKRQFDAGQADILNVFATQTALLQEQKAYLDLLNELAQAAADVTLAAGLPPARVVTEKGAEGSTVPVPPSAPGAVPPAASAPGAPAAVPTRPAV